MGLTRRDVLKSGSMALLSSAVGMQGQAAGSFGDMRPAVGDRKFSSRAVESYMSEVAARIPDAELRQLFLNCFPNTLDTTVQVGSFEGKPDTGVLTGDIAAMWLRDSSAQVWPYLPLAKKDEALRSLLEGVIRRQARCLLIDPYANAFMAKLDDPPLEWGRTDETEMKRGVGERKYELDSLCYPVRLSYGYWKATGDVKPFDAQWVEAMRAVLRTMVEQQRKTDDGPYRFQRKSPRPTETLERAGKGAPMKPVGLIVSCFRPSDDACTLPFLVPSNLFAVRSLRQMAEMMQAVGKDSATAAKASALADEVERALKQYAVAQSEHGTIWAYEVDGFGGQILMDDANVPSLLGLPYLDASPDAAMYARTRAFVWSERNPWFFRGPAGEGIGGPHIGDGMIWPMSQTMYALTSTNGDEVRKAIGMLKGSAKGTGFMHESYSVQDVARFTRPWFAWANTLFGEMVAGVAEKHPEWLRLG